MERVVVEFPKAEAEACARAASQLERIGGTGGDLSRALERVRKAYRIDYPTEPVRIEIQRPAEEGD
jgi:hypothetical protein